MNINNYTNYEVEDFVEDEYFRSWVFKEDTSLNFFWQAYLKEYPNQKSKMDEAKQLILETHTFFQKEVQAIDIPNNDFVKNLKETFEENTRQSSPKPKSRILTIYRLAAACLLLIGMFSFFYSQSRSNNRIEYSTGNGEWEMITLPDGSQVELNANSQLSLIKEWKKGEDRLVWLKGEAFFKVEKKLVTNTKFTVVTKDLRVEVLGTTFNVNTRNEHTEVFLEEGKIELELDEQKEQLEPGEFISYSQAKKQIINRYKKTDEIHSNWKNGVLKIDNAAMKDLLNEFETIYGVDIIISNDFLLSRTDSLTMAIPVNDLDMATAILERVTNVKVEKQGKQFFIK